MLKFLTVMLALASAVTAAPKAAADEEADSWFERVSISGVANAGYVQTGDNGTQSKGHFYASERLFGASLFVDARLSDSMHLHDELFLYNQQLGLKELYLQCDDVVGSHSLLSLKAGRFDLPYGEEYLWQNAFDNPMVLRSAAWPWGYSQGLTLFGRLGSLGWVASVSDGLGNDERDVDDNSDKAYNLRLSLDTLKILHLGASAMKAGAHAISAEIFNAQAIMPLGQTSLASGPSPNSMAGFEAAQADWGLQLGPNVQLRGDYGQVRVIDGEPWARTFSYYFAEAKFKLTPRLYLAGRYSAVGTFDAHKGYKFGGDYDGATGFEFDTRSLARAGGCLGFVVNEGLVLKLEADNDSVTLIDEAMAAGKSPGERRMTWAAEAAAKF